MSFVGMIAGVGIILALKFVLKNMLVDGFANMLSGGEGGNKIISMIIHLLAPGALALIFLVAASKVAVFCPQLGTFLVVIAVVVGGILGLGIAYMATSIPFLGAAIAPAIAPVIPVFWILLIVVIVEFILSIVLPIVIPGAGAILSMVINLIISVVMILILGGFAGDVFNILQCAPTTDVGFLVEIQKKLFGTWIGAGAPKF